MYFKKSVRIRARAWVKYIQELRNTCQPKESEYY